MILFAGCSSASHCDEICIVVHEQPGGFLRLSSIGGYHFVIIMIPPFTFTSLPVSGNLLVLCSPNHPLYE